MTFYVQTWDEYYTQVLTLGVISGPVEGVLTLCLVYAITAYMGGGSFWHQPMLEEVGDGKEKGEEVGANKKRKKGPAGDQRAGNRPRDRRSKKQYSGKKRGHLVGGDDRVYPNKLLTYRLYC